MEMTQSMEYLELSVWEHRVLLAAGLKTVVEVCSKTRVELAALIPGFTRSRLDNFEALLSREGTSAKATNSLRQL